ITAEDIHPCRAIAEVKIIVEMGRRPVDRKEGNAILGVGGKCLKIPGQGVKGHERSARWRYTDTSAQYQYSERAYTGHGTILQGVGRKDRQLIVPVSTS